MLNEHHDIISVHSVDKKGKQKRLQRALRDLGFDITVDGKLGKATFKAINKADSKKLWAAYRARGLHKKAVKMNVAKSGFPWIKTAMKELGTKEIRGLRHNPRVLHYMAVSNASWVKTDEVPWCGGFVGFVMKSNGYKIPKVAVRAKSWRKFGVNSFGAKYGSVAIKSRKGGGHVCIVVGRAANGKIQCIGGNQNNKVSIAEYRESDFLEFRLPKGAQVRELTSSFEGYVDTSATEA